MKKSLLIFISILFSVNAFLSFPPTTYAIPVEVTTPVVIANPIFSDPGHTAATKAGWITNAGQWAKDVAREIALTIKRSAFATFKKRVLDMMVDDIIRWINGDGEPKWFEGDFTEIGQNAFQAAVGDLALQTSLADICSPFKAKVLFTLVQPSPFQESVKCTLDQITGNVNSFLSDFKNGGWLAYNELWQPRNNYYATVLMSLDAAERAGAQAAASKQNEAIASQGFIATTRCDYYEDPNGTFNKDGSPLTPFDIEHSKRYAKKCYKTTPGSLVGQIAGKANTAHIDWLINADEIDAYVAAIADAAINRLIKEGVKGLKGLSRTSEPQQLPGNPCDGLTGSARNSCFGLDNISRITYESDRATLATQYNTTLEPRQRASALLAQVIDKQNILVSALENLYACQQSTGYSQEAKDTQQELVVAEDKLESLRTQLDDNQTIINNLELSKSTLESTSQEDGSSLILQTSYLQDVGDPLIANQVLDDAQAEFDNLAGVDAKIISVESQNSCPHTTATSTQPVL